MTLGGDTDIERTAEASSEVGRALQRSLTGQISSSSRPTARRGEPATAREPGISQRTRSSNRLAGELRGRVRAISSSGSTTRPIKLLSALDKEKFRSAPTTPVLPPLRDSMCIDITHSNFRVKTLRENHSIIGLASCLAQLEVGYNVKYPSAGPDDARLASAEVRRRM